MRKRRYTSEKCNGGKNYLVWDNETGECIGFIAQIVGRLNLQEQIIKDHEKKIEKLEKELSEQKLETLFQEKRAELLEAELMEIESNE